MKSWTWIDDLVLLELGILWLASFIYLCLKGRQEWAKYMSISCAVFLPVFGWLGWNRPAEADWPSAFRELGWLFLLFLGGLLIDLLFTFLQYRYGKFNRPFIFGMVCLSLLFCWLALFLASRH